MFFFVISYAIARLLAVVVIPQKLKVSFQMSVFVIGLKRLLHVAFVACCIICTHAIPTPDTTPV